MRSMVEGAAGRLVFEAPGTAGVGDAPSVSAAVRPIHLPMNGEEKKRPHPARAAFFSSSSSQSISAASRSVRAFSAAFMARSKAAGSRV
ncbi:hypothetical protein ABIE19_000757 [Brevundimonas faecalis]|uniref:Uncharacterized protein n=1 Tax=Brevundimonas faecalis TaxID=947378 RepID=A0ABV2R958_9CAUL